MRRMPRGFEGFGGLLGGVCRPSALEACSSVFCLFRASARSAALGHGRLRVEVGFSEEELVFRVLMVALRSRTEVTVLVFAELEYRSLGVCSLVSLM